MQMRNNRGFTLLELTITIVEIVLVVVTIVVVGIAIKGNYWFTESGVLRELQVDHPEVAKFLKVERHVFGYSKLYVENEDGTRVWYALDTCILFNYGLHPLKE